MSERPTEEQLEDPAEIGRHGCLVPPADPAPDPKPDDEPEFEEGD